jgi:arginine/lysine/ornithine decarboxylase
LDEIVAICRARKVPLIVDEAHGAHLHFLPPGHPDPALAAGADLVVQSSHKTLGSLVGSAQLHVGRHSPVAPDRVQDALNVLQTTSGSFLLLASLDLTRRALARDGRKLFADALNEARELENKIDAMPGLKVLQPETDPRLAGHRRDPLRMVINVSGTGLSGYEVERFLRTQFQVEDEMADSYNVVYVLSPNDDPPARERLLAGLRAVSEQGRVGTVHRADPLLPAPCSSLLQPPIPPLAMLPREAALGKKVSVPLVSATGRTCAEMVMFYPPGIPLLMPGELVTADTLDVCRQLLAAGAHPYASDPTFETIRVVE